jgi:hypothetical protein
MTRVISIIQLNTKICLMELAHHQPPLLDPLLQLLSRVRAVAHLRPVSILDIVRDMAGKDPQGNLGKVADFDRHYMPDGVPEPEPV